MRASAGRTRKVPTPYWISTSSGLRSDSWRAEVIVRHVCASAGSFAASAMMTKQSVIRTILDMVGGAYGFISKEVVRVEIRVRRRPNERPPGSCPRQNDRPESNRAGKPDGGAGDYHQQSPDKPEKSRHSDKM